MQSATNMQSVAAVPKSLVVTPPPHLLDRVIDSNYSGSAGLEDSGQDESFVFCRHHRNRIHVHPFFKTKNLERSISDLSLPIRHGTILLNVNNQEGRHLTVSTKIHFLGVRSKKMRRDELSTIHVFVQKIRLQAVRVTSLQRTERVLEIGRR